jgi:transposase
MALADRAGLPVAFTIASASPHETQLVEQTLKASVLPDNPDRIIGDAACDSDSLDRLLAACQIELIAPHRGTRVNITQDGRPGRRYKRRWKIERLFAWLQNSRRLVTRYERRAANFAGFVPGGTQRSQTPRCGRSHSPKVGPVQEGTTEEEGCCTRRGVGR